MALLVAPDDSVDGGPRLLVDLHVEVDAVRVPGAEGQGEEGLQEAGLALHHEVRERERVLAGLAQVLGVPPPAEEVHRGVVAPAVGRPAYNLRKSNWFSAATRIFLLVPLWARRIPEPSAAASRSCTSASWRSSRREVARPRSARRSACSSSTSCSTNRVRCTTSVEEENRAKV